MASSPTGQQHGLSSELSSLMARVAAFDAVSAERDDALRQLAATAEALRRTESQAAGYSELAQAHDTLAADFAALKAQLGLAEEESRRARPMRDALVRELQARPSRRCSATRQNPALRPAARCP